MAAVPESERPEGHAPLVEALLDRLEKLLDQVCTLYVVAIVVTRWWP